MKTIISLAVTTLLLFGSCTKAELEDIRPLKPTAAERQPEAKLAPTADKENVGELSNGDPNPF